MAYSVNDISKAVLFQVLQRRTTGKLDFMKRWRTYIAGFGNMTDEFWIGGKRFSCVSCKTLYVKSDRLSDCLRVLFLRVHFRVG